MAIIDGSLMPSGAVKENTTSLRNKKEKGENAVYGYDNNSNTYNNFNYFRTATHSAVLVYKGPSIYKQTNLPTDLAKWWFIKIKIQMFITSRNKKYDKATK